MSYQDDKRELLKLKQGIIEESDTIKEELLKSCELTGIWEKKLRDIEARKYDPAQFIDELKEQIRQIVIDVLADNSNRRVTTLSDADMKKKMAPKVAQAPKQKTAPKPAATANNQDSVVGTVCPLCGQGHLIKGKTAYGCSRWKEGCNYRLPFK